MDIYHFVKVFSCTLTHCFSSSTMAAHQMGEHYALTIEPGFRCLWLSARSACVLECLVNIRCADAKERCEKKFCISK